MNEVILCLASVCMVSWILLLMHENRGLKEDLKKLRRQLQDELARSTPRVDVGAGRKLTTSEVNRVSTAPRQR